MAPEKQSAIDLIQEMKKRSAPTEARPVEGMTVAEKDHSAAVHDTKAGWIPTAEGEALPEAQDAGKSVSTEMPGGGVQIKNPVDLRAGQFGAGLQSRGVVPDTPQYQQAVEEFRSHLDQETDRTGKLAHDNALSVIKNPTYAELDDEGKIYILTQVIEDARDEVKTRLFGHGTAEDMVEDIINRRKRKAELWSFPETASSAMLRKIESKHRLR